ncbi:RICIN domain-containing protein [Streptomyces sp. NPDC047928]|uniref:RICIN domain-containing protein n=1 Tax=unclassified Streptomyces TaxID=2593676 RepID=UPI003715414E
MASALPNSPGHSFPWPRVLAAVLVTCCVALGITASPATAAPVPPAPSPTAATTSEAAAPPAAQDCGSPIQCLDFTSLSNGRALDVQNGSLSDGAYIVTNKAPGHHQSWRLSLNAADATFAIVNNATGKCVDLGWPALRQQTCRGQQSQKWYFQPVAGSGNAFMIRNASDNSCIDLLLGAQYDDAWTGQSKCHGNANQQWSTTAAADARNLAVDHAASRCQKDTSTCSWTTRSEAPAAPLPTVCASAVWYNRTGEHITQSFAVDNTTGWQSSIGYSFSSTLGAGAAPALTAQIVSGIEVGHIWQGSTSVGNSVTVPVPAGHYGWVTLSVLAKKVTGTWTFDARGLPWKADDTVTVPLKDDPSGGATLYIANTSPTFTTCA